MAQAVGTGGGLYDKWKERNEYNLNYSQNANTAGNVATPSAQSIYEKQMGLAEQVAAEQRRIAAQANLYKQQSLADQLNQQRRNYAQSLASVNEQSYSQGSKLLKGLANRGLGTSGLLQLGDVQTQMAKGSALSDLAYQNRLGVEGINREQRQSASQLSAALRQSQLDKQQSILGAEETLYNRSQADLQRQQDVGISLVQTAVESGNLSAEEAMSLYQQLMGAKSAEELATIQSGELYQKVTNPDSSAQIERGLLGDAVFDEKYGSYNGEGLTVKVGNKTYTYNYKDKDAFNAKIQKDYDNAGLRYSGTGQIKVDAGRTGLGNALTGIWFDIVKNNPFVTSDGKRFATWNAAADHLDELKAKG